MTRARWWLKFAAVQTVLTLVLVEIALQFYNPLPFRVRGDRILLPVNATYTYENQGPKLDRHVRHTKNSLGFRGPEPPRDLASRLSIITMGGSATECMYLSDGKAWPDVLAAKLAGTFPDVWLNNAGLDGHSTYGHLRLLEQVIVRLRPKVITFLIGLNDMGLLRDNAYDRKLEPTRSVWRTMTAVATTHSELLSIAQNVKRAWSARRGGLGHSDVPLENWPRLTDDRSTWETKVREYSPALPLYEERLEAIIALCRKAGIDPVFMTQPALFGKAVDPETGIDLSAIRVHERNSGALEWQLLELTNDVTRRVASRREVLLIDLASKLPKDSRLYYDLMHFSNQGAVRVADTVASDFEPYLRKRFGNRRGTVE